MSISTALGRRQAVVSKAALADKNGDVQTGEQDIVVSTRLQPRKLEVRSKTVTPNPYGMMGSLTNCEL
jgi:hypothetical protein